MQNIFKIRKFKAGDYQWVNYEGFLTIKDQRAYIENEYRITYKNNPTFLKICIRESYIPKSRCRNYFMTSFLVDNGLIQKIEELEGKRNIDEAFIGEAHMSDAQECLETKTWKEITTKWLPKITLKTRRKKWLNLI